MKLKICGIRNPEMIDFCNQNNVEFAGFNFVPISKRKVTPEKADKLAINLKSQSVAILQNHSFDDLKNILKKFNVDVLQFHGQENAKYLQQIKKTFPAQKNWKAVSVNEQFQVSDLEELVNYVDLFLFDASNPGAGKTISDFSKLEEALAFCRENKKKFGIAGGINAENIEKYRDQFPDAELLDIASGVEKNRKFDINTAQNLVDNANHEIAGVNKEL